MKKTVKAIGILILLGISSQWAPVLTSLLVIVVMLHYATYAWQKIARLPDRHRAELVVIAATALGAGFLAKLGVGPLILTGVFLIVALPLWRLAREDPREEQEATADLEEAEP
jgi:uncharacterized membrane protein YkgB